MRYSSAKPIHDQRIPRSIVKVGCITTLAVISGLIASKLEGQREVYFSVTMSFTGAIPLLLLSYSIGLLVCMLRSSPKDRFEVFSIGFGLRIIVGVMLSYIYQAQDEQILHTQAESSAYDIQSTLGAPNGYTKMLAVLYSILGPNLLVPKIVNGLLGSITPFILYDIALSLSHNPKVARKVLYFALFFPPLLFYSGMNLKELPSAFLLGLTIWVLLVPRLTPAFKIAFALLISMVTYYLRGSWAILPGLVTFAYAIFANHVSFRAGRSLFAKKVSIVAALILILLFPLRSVVEGVLAHLNYRLFIGTYAEFGTLRTTEGSVTKELLDIEHPWSVKNMAIQIFRAPFSPSPIAVLFDPSVQTFIDSLNGITQYFLMPLAIIGLIANRRKREVLVLGLLHISMLVTIGLSLMLGLTIQRHSVPQFVVLYVLAGLGTGAWRGHSWVFAGWFVLVAAYIAIYTALKV